MFRIDYRVYKVFIGVPIFKRIEYTNAIILSFVVRPVVQSEASLKRVLADLPDNIKAIDFFPLRFLDRAINKLYSRTLKLN